MSLLSGLLARLKNLTCSVKSGKVVMKLTEAQRRVLKWLGHGWKSEPGAGMAIHVNGKRICNVDTMFALQRLGLVEQLTDHDLMLVGQWKTTEAGAALTRSLCL